jgi:hypothetical protein
MVHSEIRSGPNLQGDQDVHHQDSYDLFLATPMSSIVEDAEYVLHRRGIVKLIRRLKDELGIQRTYYAGASIAGQDEFTPENLAVDTDLIALVQSKVFCLIYPTRVVSSALIETGYALGLKKPSILFVRQRQDLPYLLAQAGTGQGSSTLPPIIVEEYFRLSDLGDRFLRLKPWIDQFSS